MTRNEPEEDLKDRMGFYVDKYMREKGLSPVAVNYMRVSSGMLHLLLFSIVSP